MITTVLLATSVLLAGLVPVAPIKGDCVRLVPDGQKEVMCLPTLADRIRFLEARRKDEKAGKPKDCWRKSLPLVLSVKATEGEKGPWKVLIGKSSDLSDARVWYRSSAKVDKATGRAEDEKSSAGVAQIEIPTANLEIATRYYWKVVCRGRCGWGCGPKHGCDACKKIVESPIASFTTEDLAPRWIAIEGRVANIRDFGGRIGRNGCRVRQGLVYRGQGLNDNSVTGEMQGPNRLMVEDVKYLTGTLGIRTDLDLRGPGETADLSSSPLGTGVKLVLRSSPCYRGIFEPDGMKTMAKNVRLFCDRSNYPIYFHCIGGADRTGALAYVLNGVLGVSRQEAETDWESTFYPRIPDENPDPNFWCRESHFNDGLAKYGTADTPWSERVILYLKACGITDGELAAIREIMLEGPEKKAQ